MGKNARDLRRLIPPLVILFAALAFLAVFLIEGESRRSRILTEYEADRIASGLVESFRTQGGGDIEGIDPRILGFGLYGPDGVLIAGFGDTPATMRVADEFSGFRYDDSRRRLYLTRPLGMGGMGGPAMRQMRQRLRPLGRGARGYLYLSMDIGDYFQRQGLFAAATYLVPLIIAGLAAIFIFLLISNIRYRRGAQERETLARLGESARTLAHEIRNPLSAIRIQTGILRQRMPEVVSPELDAIDEETARLNALSRRVSDFLKNPAGAPERLELGEFLGELALRSPHRPRFTSDPRPAIVLFDRELLRSAIENLLRNARESYGDVDVKAEIEMELSREGTRIVVTVRDRGTGIGAESIDKVFDPFFTDKVQGSGIGLPLARRFVEAAGGSLTLAPRPGGGAEARISLPAAEGS